MNKTENQEKFCNQLLAQNITNELPEFVPIYKHVKPMVQFLQDALDYGHQEALDYLKPKKTKGIKRGNKNRKKDPWLYSIILRVRVREYLQEKGLITIYDEESDRLLKWNRQDEPNLGLAGTLDSRNYRILKGRNGKLPSIGLSKRRKAFYSQEHMMEPFLIPNDHNINLLYNVIFLWDIDKNNFINLYLSCPKEWRNNIAYDYFTELLPHSATTIITKPFKDTIGEEPSEIVIERKSELQRRLL